MIPSLVVEEQPALTALPAVAAEWDALARAAGTPFLAVAWLNAWARAYARDARVVLARDGDGRLHAGAAVVRRRGSLASTSNVESGHWDVVAAGEAAAGAVWRHLLDTRPLRVRAVALPARPGPAGTPGAALVETALAEAGYVVARRPSVEPPRLELPPDWDTLLGALSRNLRAQVRRRRRLLEREGRVVLRTSTADRVTADLETFLDLEHSGWKRRHGTAIRSRPELTLLYREFASTAAREGWLRLQLLELDGRAVAGDLSCTWAGGVFMVKTAYDERLRRLSPGFVLRAEALRSAIADRFAFYDFLGGAEHYKLRWGAVVRPHVTLHAYRGALAPPMRVFESHLRPTLKTVRDGMLRRPG